MPVFANGGTGSPATMSCARTRPRAASRLYGTGASTPTASRIAACASASEITPLGVSHRPARRDVGAQPFAEGRAEVGPVERELHVGSQEVDLLADVVTTAPARVAEHLLARDQQRDRVGELQLAAAAGLDEIEH